ncbi:MAG: N-ATPase subunit AtpR [Gammaproteobacteria bacterium]
MNEPIDLLPSLIAGLGFGAFYFAGLWFSVHHFLRRRHAAMWFLLSFTARNLIVLLGFYWLTDGRPARLVAALLGFSMVRLVLSKRVAGKTASGTSMQ